MKKTIATVCNQIIRSRKGEVIGSREIVNEIYDDGQQVETITRGIVKLGDGRVVFNQVIHKNITKVNHEFNELNLLTGLIK